MDTSVIVGIILALCVAGILGVKFYQKKQNDKDYNFDNFIADYGKNIIKLLEQVIQVITTQYNPDDYDSKEDYENAIICEAIEMLKGHCTDFGIPEYIIKLIDTESLAKLITDIFNNNKIEIYSVLSVVKLSEFSKLIDNDVVDACLPATEKTEE